MRWTNTNTMVTTATTITRPDFGGKRRFWGIFEWIWSVATDFDTFSSISVSKYVCSARAMARQIRQTNTNTMVVIATTN